LGQYRFFLKLVALTLISSALLLGSAMLIGGPGYVWQQHVDYAQFLPHLVDDFPWRSPDSGFLGYNHSIKQITFYLFGISSQSRRLAAGIKALLLAPLGAVGGRLLLGSGGAPPGRLPELALDLAFALYLGTFIWLDMVWELSLGIVIFAYLLATSEQKAVKGLISAVFIPYALIDLWQLFSFAAVGMDAIAPGPYVLTDPSIYIPMVMIVTLTLYTLLIRRLWEAASTRWEARLC
jgi:hypothetical protein